MFRLSVLKREKERQGFYRDLPERLESIDDLKTLPFTTESDLAQKGGRMLLCSQGEIQRIISEQTSGTTGAGKRVFYTEGDCEHTKELFMAGLGEFIYPGSRTMVAMPFSGPSGLGELIAEAIRRIGAHPLLTGNNKTYGTDFIPQLSLFFCNSPSRLTIAPDFEWVKSLRFCISAQVKSKYSSENSHSFDAVT